MQSVVSRLFGAFAAAAIALAAGAASAVAQGSDPAAAIIVLDGSGSMWARLDGDSKQAKFYLARDALKASLGQVKGDVRIGFAAFGHRRQGDCSDLQVAMPPENQDGRERLTGLIDKHNPRGRSPLTATLKEAAKALPKGSGPRSLILVHDDLDNCSQDPCAALADLRAAHPGVVVHAIGLGLKGDDAQRLQCLVKPTGGRLIDVQAASAVNAAIDEVMKLASATTVAPAAPAATRQPTADARPAATVRPAAAVATTSPPVAGQRLALRKDGPSAVRLATLLSAGQSPIARDVRWSIKAATGAAEPLSAIGQDISVPLAAGAHVVEVRDGIAPVKFVAINVAASGETAVDVVLDAALVRARYPADVAAAGRIQFFEGDLSRPAAVLSAGELAAGIAVPPGPWIARLGDGIATHNVPFEARPGATIDLGNTWPFSRLTIAVTGAAKQSRFPATVILFEDDPDAPRGRREIKRSTAGGTMVVAPGTYAVVVRQGSIEARDRVALTAGASVQRTVTVAAARLTLASRLPGAGAAADGNEPVAYRLERLDVVPPDVITTNRRLAELDVPAGRYRIEARHGLVNARATREVTLAAGQTANVTFDQQAGLLRLVGPAGVADLLWELRDESGHPLWSTAQIAPVATLQAGRYLVRLDYRGRKLERRLDLRAGEVRTLDIKD